MYLIIQLAIPLPPFTTKGFTENQLRIHAVISSVVILLTFVVNLSILQQSFLGTLLSTPLLQEKLAENINKVVGG